MIGIYKFHWNCGRMGDLNGVFAADSDAVKSAIGKEIYFGEVLGKHSEIFGHLSEDDVQLASEDPEVVRIFCDLNLATGFNPLEYINEE